MGPTHCSWNVWMTLSLRVSPFLGGCENLLAKSSNGPELGSQPQPVLDCCEKAHPIPDRTPPGVQRGSLNASRSNAGGKRKPQPGKRERLNSVIRVIIASNWAAHTVAVFGCNHFHEEGVGFCSCLWDWGHGVRLPPLSLVSFFFF